MRKIALLAFALMVSASPVSAAENEVYLATLAGYPPFTFYEEGAEPFHEKVVPPGSDAEGFTGYSWDIARAAFHAAGYTVRLRVTPWARGMFELKDGKTDLLFPTGKNPERLEFLQYSQGSVVDVGFLVYVSGDNAIDYDDLGSLEGQTIAVLRGWNYGDEFNQADHFDRMQVDSIEQGFKLLRSGRVDGFAGYDVAWDYRLRQLGWADEFRKLAPFDNASEYITGLQTSDKATEVIEAFDRGLERIRANGTLADIRARWE